MLFKRGLNIIGALFLVLFLGFGPEAVADCAPKVVDTWDAEAGYCHGEPTDCLDECVIVEE